MKAAVRSHPELRIMGSPTFCFSFTSDEFDIYHVNDFMRERRLALQRPAVPERDPHGRDPAADAGRASSSGSRPTWPRPSPTRRRSTRRRGGLSGAIYGGVAGGLTTEVDEFIRAVMTDMLDTQQALPPPGTG